jgi:transcriptional regulator with XRE-family HTH domain
MNRERAQALRTFLIDCRARLRPVDVRLPSRNRRRVAGLRREEVAAVAGVSPKSYALFESGTAPRRFSRAFVQRVADALQLGANERVLLYALALPEPAGTLARIDRSKTSGALESVAALGRFARDVRSAASFDEAAHRAAVALLGIVKPDNISIACMRDADGAISGIPFGRKERHWKSIHDALVSETHGPLTRGTIGIAERVPLVDEVAEDPAAVIPLVKRRPDDVPYDLSCAIDEWREINGDLRTRSFFATPLFENGALRGILAASWGQPRGFQPLELDVLETLAAIVEVAGR